MNIKLYYKLSITELLNFWLSENLITSLFCVLEPFVQVQLKKLLGLEVIYIHSSP